MAVQRLKTSEEFETRISVYIDFLAGGFTPVSKYVAFDTCDDCDKSNCHLCKPVYEVQAVIFRPAKVTGGFSEITPIETDYFENKEEAISYYWYLVSKWVAKKGSC